MNRSWKARVARRTDESIFPFDGEKERERRKEEDNKEGKRGGIGGVKKRT